MMTNINDDIPDVLNEAMEGESFSQIDINIDNIEKQNILRDIDGSYGSSFPDRFDIPGDLEERDLDFRFKPGCATCALAIDDPQIHEIFRQEKNSKAVERYIHEEYGDRQKPPSYKSITTHINKHFLPEEKKRTADLIKGRARIDQKSREIAEWNRNHEVSYVRAAAHVHLDNLASVDKKSKLYLESVKAFNVTAKTIKDLMEFELKLLGVDGSTTPEEQEKRLKGWLTNLIGTMKDEDPESAKKLLSLLQKVNVPLK